MTLHPICLQGWEAVPALVPGQAGSTQYTEAECSWKLNATVIRIGIVLLMIFEIRLLSGRGDAVFMDNTSSFCSRLGRGQTPCIYTKTLYFSGVYLQPVCFFNRLFQAYYQVVVFFTPANRTTQEKNRKISTLWKNEAFDNGVFYPYETFFRFRKYCE
jgi:hypothetical protein